MNEKNTQRFPAPNNLEPMDREQFSFAFSIAIEAAHRSMPVKNPEQFSLNILDDKDKNITKISLTDNPLNRAGIVVIEHFGDDLFQFHNFMMRFMAIINLFDKKAAKDWIKNDPEDPDLSWIHPTFIYSAAEVGLKKNGNFPVRAFLKKVQEIANKEFEDLE